MKAAGVAQVDLNIFAKNRSFKFAAHVPKSRCDAIRWRARRLFNVRTMTALAGAAAMAALQSSLPGQTTAEEMRRLLWRLVPRK